jgi:hypothetical protein
LYALFAAWGTLVDAGFLIFNGNGISLAIWIAASGTLRLRQDSQDAQAEIHRAEADTRRLGLLAFPLVWCAKMNACTCG